MKDIPVIQGKYYIAQLIEEGEHEHQDFKFAISDARKISRTLSAFANNDGGRLLIGVKDNGRIAGVRNEEDIFVIEQAAACYCRPEQHLRITAFSTEEGAIVIRAEISPSTTRPVQAMDPDGKWRAYYRVADENLLAHPLMVRSWRMRNTDSGTNITDDIRHIIDIVAANKTIAIGQAIRISRMSKSKAEDAIVRLCAMNIIGFCYDGNGFALNIPKI